MDRTDARLGRLPEGPQPIPAVWRGYGLSLALVALTTMVNYALVRIGFNALAMIYLVPVIVSATYLGLHPALLASATAALAYDFFFLPPLLSLSIQDPQDLFNFVALGGVGVCVAQLAVRLRRELRANELTAALAEALQQRDNLRNTLISALGHDLRTPLTGVVAAADLLATEYPDSTPVATLRQSAWRLHRLCNDLVEMTRIESGAITMRRQPIDLTDAVAAAIADLRAALDHHRVVVDMPDGLPLVDADPRMLHHVLINLFDNAAKFAPAGTIIKAVAGCSADGVALTILDEGPGLPPGEEQRLFQLFHRADCDTLAGGTGVGLAIVKDFAEAMEVAVSAGNRTDRQGSRFALAWPATLVRHGQPQPAA